MQIAGIAEANHAEIALHNAESPFKTMVALHIDAVTPNVFIQECFDDFLEPWVSDVLTGFLRVEDGYLEMPDAPGIGVDLNEQEAKKPPYGKSNFFADVHARLGEARHGGQRVSEFGRALHC